MRTTSKKAEQTSPQIKVLRIRSHHEVYATMPAKFCFFSVGLESKIKAYDELVYKADKMARSDSINKTNNLEILEKSLHFIQATMNGLDYHSHMQSFAECDDELITTFLVKNKDIKLYLETLCCHRIKFKFNPEVIEYTRFAESFIHEIKEINKREIRLHQREESLFKTEGETLIGARKRKLSLQKNNSARQGESTSSVEMTSFQFYKA